MKFLYVDLVNRISYESKVKRNLGKSNRLSHIVPKTCFEGPPGNPEKFMGMQIGTSPGWSNRTSWGAWKGMSSGHLRDQYFPAGFNTLSNLIVANENGTFYALEIRPMRAHLNF